MAATFALLVGELLLGWLLADFFSGFFHWVEDRFGMPTTPILGPWIIAANRDHHERPTAFVDLGSFRARNQFMIVVSLIVGTALFACFGLHAWLVALMLGGAFVNEVHAWAHRPSLAPAWAKPLQESGFFQSPKHHAAHHRPPQDRAFCILTGWLNPLLDALGFWRCLERVARRAA